MSLDSNPFSKSSASTRVSILWVPEESFENTDTLVLSVDEWYVDLRVDKATGALDWAIAGQCLLKDVNPRRIVFTHTIDSNNNFNVSDPCPFVPLPNGDDLETGKMPRPGVPGNPKTDYEEVWRYLPTFNANLARMEPALAWVLESDDEGQGQAINKTFLARVGGMYLAVQQKQRHVKSHASTGGQIDGGEVSAIREEWEDGRWKVQHTIGSSHSDLPSMSTAFDKRQHTWHVPGKKVIVGNRRYIVRAFEEAKTNTPSLKLAKL